MSISLDSLVASCDFMRLDTTARNLVVLLDAENIRTVYKYGGATKLDAVL